MSNERNKFQAHFDYKIQKVGKVYYDKGIFGLDDWTILSIGVHLTPDNFALAVVDYVNGVISSHISQYTTLEDIIITQRQEILALQMEMEMYRNLVYRDNGEDNGRPRDTQYNSKPDTDMGKDAQ